MGLEEKVDILEDEKIDKSVYYYLKNLFNNLKIEILGKYEGNILDLMIRNKLEGWCWQTTETAALFMPEDTIIYRANLYFTETKKYYHSFIGFKYQDKEYVFDPCFCMVNTKDLYFDTFDVDIKGYTTAKEIQEYFINYVREKQQNDDSTDCMKNLFKNNKNSKANLSQSEIFMRKFFGDDYREKEKEIVIYSEDEDPSSPMYRNGSGYKSIKIENNKIKSLIVHYYMGDL